MQIKYFTDSIARYKVQVFQQQYRYIQLKYFMNSIATFLIKPFQN